MKKKIVLFSSLAAFMLVYFNSFAVDVSAYAAELTAYSSDEVKELYDNSGGNPDVEKPQSKPSQNEWGNWGDFMKPDHNGVGNGSFSDDYTSFEQGEFLSSSLKTGVLTTPLDLQGSENRTDIYAGYAFCISIIFVLFAICMFLQYRKINNNRLSPIHHNPKNQT